MDYTIFTFPVSLTEIESIENIVERAGCLFTSFNFLQEEQYRTKTFLFNDDLEFRVLLDRNFVSELVHIFSLVTTQKNFELSEEQRIIAAHQAFFQLSNILCEPNISYYEYADQQNHHNVSKELNVFRKADNLPTEIWVSLALGKYPLISPMLSAHLLWHSTAIKKIIPLLFASYDEEIVDFHKRIKNVFIESWGKNTGIGKKIYKARFHKKAYSQERKVNQDNFSEHIEKIKKELNEELMLELQ